VKWTLKRWARAGICAVTFSLLWASSAHAYTANKVWFEFRRGGVYRVYVSYTVPALKEFRESYVDFRSKKKAESFYWDLIRGADFYPPQADERRFVNQPLEPSRW